MTSFNKTLVALLSFLVDMIHKNEPIDAFCSKFKSLELVHPRFYPILEECYKHSEKKNPYCTCGEEDCDCMDYNF